MLCPKCFAEFESGARSCPECGVQLFRNVSGIMKTSSVMIAEGEEQTFYRSVRDVPEPLRSRLIESTHGANSGTIVIADRAGKDQITQVIARRENAKERAAAREIEAPVVEPPAPAWHAFMDRSFLGLGLTVWAGIFLFLCALSLIISVFFWK